MNTSDIFITCNPKIGTFLAEEVKSLGFNTNEVTDKGVSIRGSYNDTIDLNLRLRTANRVLFKINEFQARDLNEIYSRTYAFDWTSVLAHNCYFSIDSSVKHSSIKDSRFLNLKLKDAIVDKLRKKTGRRPDSGPKKDQCVLFVHWHNNLAKVYIDTSGESISKHGYRKNPHKAPMIESLASAVIMASGWDLKQSFINPMCGSGTLAIEAALMSQKKPPCHFRSNYGFMHTKFYDPGIYQRKKLDCLSIKGMEAPQIIATDIDPRAIRASRANAKSAGVDQFINFKISDYKETNIPEGPGIILLNPEYGERLGEQNALENTYEEIGNFFKQKCAGKTGYIFTGNLDLAKKVGLKTSARTIFYNGKIECRLLKYDLYKGSKKNNIG